MPTVETMKGPIDTADLGATLMHEHVFVLTHEIQHNYDTEFDPAHPLGCHRRRVPDRIIFDKLLAVLVFGCSYVKIADTTCSATTSVRLWVTPPARKYRRATRPTASPRACACPTSRSCSSTASWRSRGSLSP